MKVPGKRSDFFAPVQRKVLRDKIKAYLGGVKPVAILDRSDAELDAMIDASITLGETLGLRKVSGQKRLAYLYLLSEGLIATTPEALDFIRFGGSDPDSQTSALIKHTAKAIEDGAAFPVTD